MQYKNLWGYVRDIYQTSTVNSTVHIQHMKEIYWKSKIANPSLIVPIGPKLDFEERHYRENPGSGHC